MATSEMHTKEVLPGHFLNWFPNEEMFKAVPAIQSRVAWPKKAEHLLCASICGALSGYVRSGITDSSSHKQ